MFGKQRQMPKPTEIDNRAFYKRVFALVVPMSVQNLINVGVTATDVIMLGIVGETVLSAGSLANQIQFIMTLILFGLTSGATVLTSQYWGKGDRRTIEKVLGITLRFSIMIGIFFFLAAFFFPGHLMKIYTSEPEVIAEGVKYLRVVSFSYLFSSITMVYLNLIRSVERVLVSMVVYFISLVTNIIVNWFLIYGNLGFPQLEIRGAAIGTVTARAVELLLMIGYALWINKDIRIRIRDIFRRESWLFRDFLTYSGPVVVNELMWGLGASANTAIIGHLGSAAVAANSVAQVERQLATVVSFGLSAAAAIIVGKAIGENQLEQAKVYAKKLVRITIIAGCIGAAIILASSSFVIKAMSLSQQARQYLMFMLIVMSYFAVCQAYNSTMVVGIFRAGGDTRFGLFMDVGTMWGCSILIGAAAAFWFHWSVPVVYIILMSDEVIKLPLSYFRYRSLRWLRHVTRE